MYSSSFYLLSGATATGIGPVLYCLGMDKFSVSVSSTSFGANIATGTIRVEGRLDPGEPYNLLFSQNFASNTGIMVRFDGPLESIRGVLTPLTTGTFTSVVRYSSLNK